MGKRNTAKSLPAAKPSDEGQGPESRGQKPAGDEKQPGAEYRPKLWRKPLTDVELKQLFFLYNRYKHNGRPLTREEISAMKGHMHDKACPVSSLHELFNTFDEPKHPLTIQYQSSYEGLEEGLEETLFAEAESLYKDLCKKVGFYAAIAKSLNGLKKRLPVPSFVWPYWADFLIWWDLLLSLYALRNWCEDGEGKKLTTEVAHKIAEVQVFKVKSRSRVFVTLADEEHEITKALAETLKDKEFALFFGEKAHGWQKQYALENSLPEPRLILPFDPLQQLSQSMASSSIAAIAAAPDQPTRKPGQPRFPNKIIDSPPPSASSIAPIASAPDQPTREPGQPSQPRFPNKIMNSPSPSAQQEQSEKAEDKGGKKSSKKGKEKAQRRDNKDSRSKSPQPEGVRQRRETGREWRDRHGFEQFGDQH